MCSETAASFYAISSSGLAVQVAQQLGCALLFPRVVQFETGELAVHVDEQSFGCVYLWWQPAHDLHTQLMLLLLAVQELKKRKTEQLILIAPYLPYARQPQSAWQLLINMFEQAGIDTIVTLHPHQSEQGESYVCVVDIASILMKFILKQYSDPSPVCLIAPDHGAWPLVRRVAHDLKLPCIMLMKERDSVSGEIIITSMVGTKKGTVAIIIDDMIDSGKTICIAATFLREQGYTTIHAYATHALFSGGARMRIEQSCIDQLWVSNSLPVQEEGKIQVWDTAEGIAERVRKLKKLT